MTKTERYIDPIVRVVWGVSAGLLWLGLVPTYVLALLLGHLGLFPRIAPWLLIPCVALDLSSLYLRVAAVLRKHGPSTIPGLALAYYLVTGILGLQLDWWWRGAALLGLTVFHLSCHFWVPQAIARRLGSHGGCSAT